MSTDSAYTPQPLTVVLPAAVQAALDDVSQRENLSQEQVVSEAIREHLFLRQFRNMRECMTGVARAQGIETDQDVFDQVS
jgi:hypothetical protein